MSEQEVIACIKEHLKYHMNRYNTISKKCKKDCIERIKGFLPKISKAEAETLFEDKILFEKTVPSEYDSNILFHKYINGVVVELKKPLILDNSDIGLFVKELQMVGGVV